MTLFFDKTVEIAGIISRAGPDALVFSANNQLGNMDLRLEPKIVEEILRTFDLPKLRSLVDAKFKIIIG